MRRVGLLVSFMSLLALAAVATSGIGAQSPDLLVDGGFEAAGDGWAPPAGASLAVDGAGPVHSGAAAGRVTAGGPGGVALLTQYWRVSVAPLAEHTLRAWVYADDPALSNLSVTLEFLDGAGAVIGAPLTASLGGLAAQWRLAVAGPVAAPPDAAHARVAVRAVAKAAGATFHVDSVTLEAGAAPTATATATATASGTATASATGTASSTATASATATTSPTATSTIATPTVFEVLTNGNFEVPGQLFGWRNHGGLGLIATGIGDSPQTAVLFSETSSTKWLHQSIVVEPGGWYEAGGRLWPQAGVALARVRVAWYATPDASGRQLETVDSQELLGTSGGLVTVETGPIQAPPEARSAQLRIMLQPAGGGPATLAADDVYFIPSAEPTATPSPSPTATPTASPPRRQQ